MNVRIVNKRNGDSIELIVKSLRHGARVAAAWVDAPVYRLDKTDDGYYVCYGANVYAEVKKA